MLKWNCGIKWSFLIVTYLNKRETGYVRCQDHAAFVKYRRLMFVRINGVADIDVQLFQPVVVVVPLPLAFVVITCIYLSPGVFERTMAGELHRECHKTTSCSSFGFS